MAKPFVQIFQDGQGNWDEQAMLSIFGVLTLCVCELWSVIVKHQPFDAQSFGVALGTAMGATLIGLGYRASKGNPPAVAPGPGATEADK